VICPHCKKPIPRARHFSVAPEIRKKVLVLHKQGYSFRDIEMLLERQVSFSTASRIVRESK